VLLLDNGDVNKGYGRQPELKYETAMKAMSDMGYTAANVGEEDLVLGIDYLKYVADFARVPLLSANIVNAEGEPVFEQFVLREMRVGDTSVSAAVIGVLSTEFKEKVEEINPELVVEEYDSELERLIGRLRDRSDLLILLAHMSVDEARTLAGSFPQFDLIITSHSGDDPLPTPVMVSDVPIAFAGVGGMHVGTARFKLGGKRTTLEAYSIKKLDGTFGDSPRMLALLEDYQQMVKAERLLEAFPRSEYGEAEFTGNKDCTRCHSLPSFRFRKEKHAHAFEPIVEKGHEYDPECVRCHTVGFGYTSGFISPDITPELKHVGCEDCHGPGSKHLEEPLEGEYGEVKRETCESCHNPANSPKFVYEEYVKKINHNTIFLCSARVCHWLD
jgi:hypothetical protein